MALDDDMVSLFSEFATGAFVLRTPDQQYKCGICHKLSTSPYKDGLWRNAVKRNVAPGYHTSLEFHHESCLLRRSYICLQDILNYDESAIVESMMELAGMNDD